MRAMVGCSGMIAAVAFVFGLIGSLFATEASLVERLVLAAMPAGMAFVAALLLFSMDHARHTTAKRMVRKMLLARQDVADDDFLGHFTSGNLSLIAETRRAVAEFFGVPTQKVHPTDNLREDLDFDSLEPGFHTFVVYRVMATNNVVPQPFVFKTSHLVNIGDLAVEVQRVLDSFNGGTPYLGSK